MNLERITTDSALRGKRAKCCSRRFKINDEVLTYFHPNGVMGTWVAWHAACVQQIIRPKPNEATPAEVAAFVARETARVEARRAQRTMA